MKPEEVTAVGVVGCGLMGSGIVEVCARTGLDVTFVEATEELVERGRASIARSLSKAVDRGKLSQQDSDGVVSRIHGAIELDRLAGSDVVIEAATEDAAAKADVFAQLGLVTRDDVVLASNTSSIPIIDLGIASGRGDRVVGIHFFNPPPVMKLVELTPSILTSEDTLGFARGFAERLGKTSVVAKDHAGFIVNRLLLPYLFDAIRLYDEGFATKEDIDAAISLGLGHPMGPLTLMDLIGLDTMLAVGDVLHREFGEPRYSAPPLLRRMVAAGRLGRKSGSGFYDY
jgi:3-hydroxybutyryl-CoA dehydrogenase